MSNKSKNLPAQILVLGMHRSGTSALTGALSSAGVFVGGEQELTGTNWENPKGFFERRDARNICDALLHGSGADWWKVSRFSPDNADHEVVRAKRSEIGELVSQLNERAENAWALKEPRLCVLLPIFRSFLSKPFAIIVARHPVEVARSLRRRNGFPIAVGMALWEAYMCSAMQHAADLEHFVVRYDEILDEPERLFAELFEWLEQRGVAGLDATAAINSISPELRRERARDEDSKLLTRAQKALWKRLSDRQISEPPPVLSPAAQALLHEFESDQAVVERLRAQTQEQNRELKRSSEKLERLQSDLQNHREKEKKLEQRLIRASGLEDELAQAKSHIETLKSELAQTHTRLEELEPLRDVLAERERQLGATKGEVDTLAERYKACERKQTEKTRAQEALLKRQNERIELFETQLERLSRSRALRFANRLQFLPLNPLRWPRQLELRKRARRIIAAGLFDSDWYLKQYPDVCLSAASPVVHYLDHGASEGRWPHPVFDPKWYAEQLSNVTFETTTPVEHYLDAAPGQRVSPHPMFDEKWYLENNPDVFEDGCAPLTHFLLYGGIEGRSPHPEFDAARYLAEYSGVRSSQINPLVHYLERSVAGAPDKGFRCHARGNVGAKDDEDGARKFGGQSQVQEEQKISTQVPSLGSGAALLQANPTNRFQPRTPAFAAFNEIGLVSVLIPVHNALEEVRRCIASVLKNTFPTIELVIVDDGSEAETRAWLEQLAAETPHVRHVRNAQAAGYTLAVNQAADVAAGDYLVILNSDTIVPPFWLERLLAPIIDDPSIVASGPVSNAASWQSLPKIRDDDGGWAVNTLRDDVSVAGYDRFVQRQARGLKPARVELLNGFCYAIRSEVFHELGKLDSEAFPSGYGEETDLFLRLAERDMAAAVACNLYVFHAKSKSFGRSRRKALSQRGNQVLDARWGRTRIEAAADTLATCASLSVLRWRCQDEDPRDASIVRPGPLRILFLLPVRPGGGGVHSVAQEAQGLAALGHTVTVMVPEKHFNAYRTFYPALCDSGLFQTYGDKDDLLAHTYTNDVIVATHFSSVRLLKRSRAELKNSLFLYYVQDYEPWIVPSGSRAFDEAFASYGELENMVLVAKTRWLCRKVYEEHGLYAHKIAPSIESGIFNCVEKRQFNPERVRIAAMVRPNTARRAPQATIDVLVEISAVLGDVVEFDVFGCDDEQLSSLSVPDGLALRNHGVLTREEVAKVLKRADLFIDMSIYQAFGRTAVEAMACGTVAAIPQIGGGAEYSMNGRAALQLPTEDPEECAALIGDLLRNPSRFEEMREWGLKSAAQFSIDKAALSLEQVLHAHLA